MFQESESSDHVGHFALHGIAGALWEGGSPKEFGGYGKESHSIPEACNMCQTTTPNTPPGLGFSLGACLGGAPERGCDFRHSKRGVHRRESPESLQRLRKGRCLSVKTMLGGEVAAKRIPLDLRAEAQEGRLHRKVHWEDGLKSAWNSDMGY